jgi:CRP/FNR family cyclic AMP-dependent transcriptional regulator
VTSSTKADQLHELALSDLAARGTIVSYRKNVRLISEGDQDDCMYVILRGKVKVFSVGRSGKEVILDVHGPGETVGEMALDGGTRSASVQTIEPTTCSVVSRQALRQAIVENPDFALQQIVRLIGRTRLAVENVKRIALLDVEGRLRDILTKGATEKSGVGLFAPRMTQLELAERVGASRDMVSRILRDFESKGLIELRSRQIRILQPLT